MTLQELYNQVKCKAEPDEFKKGFDMEQEHRSLFDGSKDEVDLKIAKIVQQHLMEDDEYYSKISELLEEDDDEEDDD